MSKSDPCPHNGPAHDYEPLRTEKTWYRGDSPILAICRKCGGYAT